MNYKTHINGGILAGLYMTSQMKYIHIIPTAVFMGGVMLGSLLPDIDHKSSYIGSKTKPVSRVVNKLAGHRKLFHAPLLYLFLKSISIGLTTNKLGIFFINGLFLGVLSHLVLDSLTIGGLPWFYPISKKKFSLAKIKTNSEIELILCGVLTCINIAMALDILHITRIFTFTQH